MTAALALKGPLRAPGEVGRPSTYTPEMGERVCEALESGTSIRGLRALWWAPEPATLYRWAEAFPEFQQRFALARRVLAATYASETVSIADNVDPDAEGGIGSARVGKSRIQVEARRWIAGCLDREAWGDKTQVDVSAVVAVVTLPLDLMLPAATAATNDGRNVHDPRVLELRALAAARRPVDGKQGA